MHRMPYGSQHGNHPDIAEIHKKYVHTFVDKLTSIQLMYVHMYQCLYFDINARKTYKWAYQLFSYCRCQKCIKIISQVNHRPIG